MADGRILAVWAAAALLAVAAVAQGADSFRGARRRTVRERTARFLEGGAFANGWADRLAEKDAKFRLRQNTSSGAWEISPVKPYRFRAVTKESSRTVFAFERKPVGTVVRVESLPAEDGTPLTVKRHALKVNGKVLEIPFPAKPGVTAELEDGVWTLYSPEGRPLERKANGDRLDFDAGDNDVAYAGRTAEGRRPCADVTVFAVGQAEPALLPREKMTAGVRRALSQEAVDPQWYEPEKGFVSVLPLMVRPGERARLEMTVHGPMPSFRLYIGEVPSGDFPAVEKGDMRQFGVPGVFSGVSDMKIVRAHKTETAARLDFLKLY